MTSHGKKKAGMYCGDYGGNPLQSQDSSQSSEKMIAFLKRLLYGTEFSVSPVSFFW